MAKNLQNWDPEDNKQWKFYGKAIANKNLWISIPSLLCGFSVWLYWGIITVQMLNLGFPFKQAELFTLMAISGLSGATLRIPSSFFIRLAGGRNTIFLTTFLLILPALGTGLALQDKSTPLWQFQLLALLSGIGGGNFASSMSNISYFFPKKVQGTALGLNAGLGNFGVTAMQVLIPFVMTFGIFGGDSMTLLNFSGTIFGKIPTGSETWIHNAAYIWVVFLVPLSVIIWFGMDNIVDPHVSPNIGHPIGAFTKILLMLCAGLVTAAIGLWLMLPKEVNGAGLEIDKLIVLPLVIIITVVLIRQLPLGDTYRASMERQYGIFTNKHTWSMSLIYTMTFGSFIGYSAAFALAIKIIFGFKHIVVNGALTHNTINPDGPAALMFAWIGPFIGSLTRPVGGKIADKFGGARVTQFVSIIMVICTVGLAYYMKKAYASAMPEEFFYQFLVLFLILFTATGIGNGSVFRTIAVIFDKEAAGPVLGWASAIAAYGAFFIPKVLGEQIELATPEKALYGFVFFYLCCIIINWWFYLRKNAYIKNV